MYFPISSVEYSHTSLLFLCENSYLPFISKFHLIVNSQSEEFTSVAVGEVTLIVNRHDGLDAIV